MTDRPIRVSYGSIPRVRMTPMVGSKIKRVADLGTIALRFTRDEALDASRLLWLAAQDATTGTVDLTGFRKTGQVTITRPL